MTKQEYERVRQEVAQRYKNEISELKLLNQKYNELYMEEREKRYLAEQKLQTLQNKLNNIPESFRSFMELLNLHTFL